MVDRDMEMLAGIQSLKISICNLLQLSALLEP
jgi:hypothetical protein